MAHRSFRTAAIMMVALLLTATACGASTGAQASTGTTLHSRKMLQIWGTRSSQLATNSLRSSIATSQAIDDAVNSGAQLGRTRRAGAVGSTMSWAAGQNNQAVFNTVERAWGRRKT